MANDQTNTPNPQSRGGEGEGDKQELFFGKYKTKEDAETAYKEAERKMHDATSEAARWKEIAENQKAQPESSRETVREEQPVTRYQDTGEGQQFLTRLYSEPLKVKEEIKREAVREAREVIRKETQESTNLASRVNAWSSKNRDLDNYQDLLQVEVAKTDARLSVETRLTEAAGRVRNRLAELRGTRNQNREPGPSDYVPGPSGDRDDGGDRRYVDSQQPNQPDPEAELKSAIDKRNATRFKRPGTHGR